MLNLYKVETISLYYLGCENLVSLVRLSVRNNLLAHVNELNCLVNLMHLAVLEIEGKLHHVHVQQEMCVLMTAKCGACMVLCKGNPLSGQVCLLGCITLLDRSEMGCSQDSHECIHQ